MKEKKSPQRITEKMLRDELDDLLQRSDEAFDPGRRWDLLQTARDRMNLLHQLRKLKAGWSSWATVGFSFGLTAITIVLLISIWPKSRFYTYPDDYLRTIENVGTCLPDGTCGYRRVMQEVVNGVPQPEVEMNFCQMPRFEAGHVLKWARIVQRGSCTAIDGFDVVRGSDRKPQLAPNCNPDYSEAPIAGHINCPGGRAIF